MPKGIPKPQSKTPVVAPSDADPAPQVEPPRSFSVNKQRAPLSSVQATWSEARGSSSGGRRSRMHATPSAIYDQRLKPLNLEGQQEIRSGEWKEDTAMSEWYRLICLRKKEEKARRNRQEAKDDQKIFEKIRKQHELEVVFRNRQQFELEQQYAHEIKHMSANKFQAAGNLVRLQPAAPPDVGGLVGQPAAQKSPVEEKDDEPILEEQPKAAPPVERRALQFRNIPPPPKKKTNFLPDAPTKDAAIWISPGVFQTKKLYV